MREIAEARHPRDKARILAAHLRETTARSADVQSVVESAAATDAEQRALRADLSIEHFADRLWWYAGAWAYRGLFGKRGWSLDEFENWLAETLYAQLMARPAGSSIR